MSGVGTESRQRTKLLGVRLLPEEHEALRAVADNLGVSMSEVVMQSLRKVVPGVVLEGTQVA